jgi:RNA polymerase sigma factor (sigma-70 family)
MDTPFLGSNSTDDDDRALAAAAVAGSRQALEDLIRRHQSWIYNIALRMVWLPEDAEDVTQEILIKVVTRLASYRGDGAFRTWLYRIVANHVTNMRRRRAERSYVSFRSYGCSIDATPDLEVPDSTAVPVDIRVILEEIRIGCMMGMILCLDRTQRLAFILGSLLGADAQRGGEIMGISGESFRQKLSRGRRKIAQFMDDKCGLMREDNPCNCARKAQALILAGHVRPERLRFTTTDTLRIKEIACQELENMNDALEVRSTQLVVDQPFYDSPDFVCALRETINQPAIQRLLARN